MHKKCLLLLCTALFLYPLPASPRTGPEIGVQTAVVNRYVWRGIVVSDIPVMQPSFTVGMAGFSATVWGNIDLEDGQSFDPSPNEIDYSAEYAFAAGELDFAAGGLYYTFPGTNTGATTELYAGVAWPSVLNPSLTVYQDVQECDGSYLALGIEPSIALHNWRSSLEWSLSVGYGSGKHNGFYYGEGSAGLTDLYLGLGMPFTLSPGATLTPGIAYVDMLASSSPAFMGRQRSLLVSLNFSTAF